VAGYVRNLAGGEVEAVFEGDPSAVETLIEFCRRGPRGAEVADVEVDDVPAAGRTGFEVR
jgi:acylphosphatase